MKLHEAFGRRELLRYGTAAAAAGSALLIPHLAFAEEAPPLTPEPKERFEPGLLMFHEIDYGGFKASMEGLLGSGWQPIELEAIVRGMRAQQRIPQKTPYFHITIDDGLKSQLEVVRAVDDIVKSGGPFIPLTFFVMTKFADLDKPTAEIPDETPSYNDGVHAYMTKKDMVGILQKGHRLANHTANHADAWKLTLKDYIADIDRGESRVNDLWKLSGREREYKEFAYPYGHFKPGVLEYLLQQKYDIAFTTTVENDDPSYASLTIKRIGKT